MPYATNDGIRIRYEVEGSGPPLVLHIGFLGCLEDWLDAGYAAALRDDYRLVLLDPRGQGDSDKPHDPSAYGPRDRVGDVLAVLDGLGIDRAHFWGYSLGGRVGVALGILAPHRLLSLILGGADADPPNPRPIEDDPWLREFRLGMPALVAWCEDRDPAFFVSAGERARWLAADPEALAAAYLAGRAAPGFRHDLPGIRVPTLLYCGALDDPDRVERTACAMPEATLVALDGLDHAAAINRCDLILPHVLPFLRRASGTRLADAG